MSQPQPASLPYWRTRAVEVGAFRALKEASEHIDDLTDQLGRRHDLRSAIRFGVFAAGFASGLAIVVAVSCTVIGHKKVDGWPTLTVYEHHVPHHVMRDKCVQYAPFGMSPEACAEFNLEERRCDLYFSADFPPPAFFVKHERMHCDGYDHEGETHMRDFLRNYEVTK